MDAQEFATLVSKDLTSLLSDTAKKTTDTGSISLGSSVSTDKLIKEIGTNPTTSNIFGVFDTKQVVKELSADTNSPYSTDFIDKVSPESLTNLATKTGAEITTDLKYSETVDTVMSSFSDLKQTALGLADMQQNITSSISTVASKGTNFFTTGNLSLDNTISSFIPKDMTLGDYDSLRTFFHTAGIDKFNVCDGLSSIMSLANRLIDPNALKNAVAGLFGLIANYDIKGILNCISKAESSIDIASRTGFSNLLVNKGAINGLSDFTSYGTNGNIINKYDSVRQIAASRQTSYNQSTGLYSGGFSSADTSSSMDGLLTNLDVDKADIYQTKTFNTASNNSILSQIDEPVYNLSSVKSASDNGFTNYCFNGSGTDSLLKTIPDDLFL